MVKLGFVGSNNIDIMLYFSRLLFNLKRKVIIMDASKEQLLRYSLPDENCDNLLYRGVEIFLNINSKEQLDKLGTNGADVILVNYGVNLDVVTDIPGCNAVFLITDFERNHILALKTLLDRLVSVEIIKVYRDFVKSKISSKYIDNFLGIHRFTTAREYILPLYANDARHRLLSQYDDIFGFDGVSERLKDILIDFTEENLGIHHKEVIKALKMAERGK